MTLFFTCSVRSIQLILFKLVFVLDMHITSFFEGFSWSHLDAQYSVALTQCCRLLMVDPISGIDEHFTSCVSSANKWWPRCNSPMRFSSFSVTQLTHAVLEPTIVVHWTWYCIFGLLRTVVECLLSQWNDGFCMQIEGLAASYVIQIAQCIWQPQLSPLSLRWNLA